MKKSLSFVAAGLTIAQPVIASPSTKAGNDRELHEIVFQNYPEHALKAGQEGPVFFSVTLDKDAYPVSCQVTHGSGYPDLDEETCDLIVQHAVFKSALDANGRLAKQTAEGVVNWTLPGHTPAPINFTPAAAASKPEQRVCKRNLRAGTLSSFDRVCMTPTEWAKQADNMKQVYEDMQGKKGASVCGEVPGAGVLARQEGVSAGPPPGC